MLKEQSVTLSLASGSDKEYIVRDRSGITIGRIYIVELSKENLYCSFRIKFYRRGNENYKFLQDALNLLLISIFRNMRLNKANAIVDEDTDTTPFSELGFQLEGIFSNTIKGSNSIYRDELIFGITANSFDNNFKGNTETLVGKNIELRILTPNEAEELKNYYVKNREYLREFEPSRDESFYTLDAQRKDLTENYRQYLNGHGANFGIYKDNKFIGKIRISNIVVGVFKSAFVGYSIDKEHQGKGYMKESLNLILDFAAEELGLHRLEASTLVDNLKSQGVLSGCGFKKVGVNEKYLYINGNWRDHITFYKILNN